MVRWSTLSGALDPMTAIARLVGVGRVPRGLHALLLVSGLSGVAFAALFGYVGIWAVQELRAGPAVVGVMFGLDAIGGALGAYVGGRLSDHVGRRAVFGAAMIVESAAILALIGAGHRVPLGIGLVVLASTASGPVLAATNAAVADLVAEDDREHAYALMRVVFNLSFALGPPVGGLLIFAFGWPALFLGAGIIGFVAGLAALRLLPVTRPATGDHPQERRSSLTRLFGDGPFLLLLLSNLMGFVIYVAYEAILPIVSVTSYGISQGAWGLLAAINPVLVIALQLRLTQAVEPWRPAVKLAGSVLLMGVSFLLLAVNASPAAIAAVIIVFALGEMVWAPTAQALASRLAPEDMRGAYMGAFGATTNAAWAFAPAAALSLRAARGDDAVWLFFAASGLVAALAGAVSARAAAARSWASD